MPRRPVVALGLLSLCALVVLTAARAEAPAGPSEIEALVARLSDAQVRQLLVAQLTGAGGAAPPAEASRPPAPARPAADMSEMAGMLDGMGHEAMTLRAKGRRLLEARREVPVAVGQALDRLTEGGGPRQLVRLLGGGLALLGLGLAAEWLVRRRMAEPRRRLEAAPAAGLPVTLGRALLRAVMDLLALAVFALVIFAVYFAVHSGNDAVRLVVTTYVAALVIVRLAGVASRLIFSPGAPALRWVPLDDAAAATLHRWMVALAAVGAFGFLTSGLFRLLGLSDDAHLLLVALVGTTMAAMVVALIWRRRAPVAAAIRGDEADDPEPAGRLRAQFADLWHLLATVYVVVIWGLWTFNLVTGRHTKVGSVLLSVLIVVAIPAADRGIRRLLAAAYTGPGALPERGRYVPAVRRGIHAALGVAAALVLLNVWGADLFTMTQNRFGELFARAALKSVVILLFGYITWELVRVGIDRKLGVRETEGGVVEASARARTLLPLLRNFALGVVMTMVAMTIVSSFGVDIGPLLAGAGIVGLAVGFGAQTLVRDIVSGIFFLIDDAFRVGEDVDVGGLQGTVEAISIRSLRLRHYTGAVHTVPFGQIKSVTNGSRDWVIQKLVLRVPHDTDIDRVRKILKRVGQEMLEDPELGPSLIEPLKSQGVSKVDDAAMIIRAKFKAKPGEQYVLQRAAFTRIKKAFDENGIRFARRDVMVVAPPETRDAKVAAAAAAAAVAAERGE